MQEQGKWRAYLLALAGTFLLSVSTAFGQEYTQTLKGIVLDKALKTPLVGATVVLRSVEPHRGMSTNTEGQFRFTAVPLGKHTLEVSYLGYAPLVIPNITLNSGKETTLTIELEESVFTEKEVVITAKIDKEKPLNELAAVSSRTFSVEETQRFAAAVNDPARMASSFAGVAMPGDGNNTIVIRGNAPNGLLWRMEGVDIPNPNHFSQVGSSGGGISILSAQLLTNSDFLTGAFPAEYGNAVSGVFDLKMRKGNSEKREYTVQAGVLGLDLAAEGPLRLGQQRGSFLVNYRYSTLSLVGKLGVPLGDAVTNFQDLSFNLWMPAGKAGNFTLFGIGGLSDQTYKGSADSLKWAEDDYTRFDGRFLSNTGVIGLTHSILLGNQTALKTVVALSSTENGERTDQYIENYQLQRFFDNAHLQQKMTVSSTLNHKFNAHHLLRTGAYVHFTGFDFSQHYRDTEQDRLVEQLRNNGNATTINTFAQWQYRPNAKLTLSAGAHGLFFLLNNTWSAEPRASVKYALTPHSTLSAGYGRHAQVQPLGVYYSKLENAAGQFTTPNKNTGLTRADHWVLSYDQTLPGNWHIKPEIYLQELSNVPVNSAERDAFSMLNLEGGFVSESLENTGQGRNYGAELTVEKFLTKGFYCLLSTAIFESKYKGSDGIWRDTRFNTNYVSSLVAGKEWAWNTRKKDRSFGVNIKLTHSGGLRETPIDLAASIAAGEAVYQETHAFEDKMVDYFRMDTGVRIKRNYAHLTTTLSFDLQNATNRKNVFGRYYSESTQEIKTYYQSPLIPVLAYKLEF